MFFSRKRVIQPNGEDSHDVPIHALPAAAFLPDEYGPRRLSHTRALAEKVLCQLRQANDSCGQ